MVDCAQDANGKWRPQHRKDTSFAGLGNNLKCISTNDHRTCPCKHTTGCNTTACMCALAHLRKVTAGDDQPAVQRRSTLSHIFLRYFEPHVPRVTPGMQCSLYNSPSAGLSQNLQSSPFFKNNIIEPVPPNPHTFSGHYLYGTDGKFLNHILYTEYTLITSWSLWFW